MKIGNHGHMESSETNNSDHNERFYIVRVTQTGRLITQNTRHLQSSLITTEQYLCEQIKKGTGQLEDIFMKTVAVEHGRMVRSYTADMQTNMAHNETREEDNISNA